MRTSNEKVRNIIISLYFVLIVLAVLFSTLFTSLKELVGNPSLTLPIVLLVLALLFVITHSVSKYFEYDSDGVKVVVINKGLLLSDYFNYRERKVEFEKHRLIAFKIYNYFFYKSLVLYIRSSNGKYKKKERFNVTLVNRKKRKYIKQSLSKIIKKNINNPKSKEL